MLIVPQAIKNSGPHGSAVCIRLYSDELERLDAFDCLCGIDDGIIVV
ncbi:MAG: hypothetical protein IIZ10_04190 [Solobacterium sp.]|nr:hypothetical protein [Solobacterium sp.]